MRWLVGILKQFAGRAVWQIVFAWIKKLSWWDSVGGVVAWLMGQWGNFSLELKIVLALLGFCLSMAIRQTWFPHGFFKKKRLRSVENGKRPHVIPVESGWDERHYSGLFFKNNGDAPAYSVVVEPLQLGEAAVEFTGPEITYLEPGESFFLYPENWPPSIILLNKPFGNSLFELIRSWQLDIGDLKAAAKGCIQYKDGSGSEYEIRYRIRRDVLNRKSGLAIEVELG